MDLRQSLFNRYTSKAKKSDVIKISEQLEKMKRGPVKEIWAKVQALYNLAKDPKIAWKSKALAIGSLVYLISPLDAVPDLLPGAGLTDDVAIILGTIGLLGHEVKKYLKETAEDLAEVEIKKRLKIMRIVLITSISIAIIAILTKLMMKKFNL